MSNVDINVDRWMDGLMDGRKIGRLYRTLLQAGAIKMVNGRYYEYLNDCSIGKSIK